jgi:hypothetical protein
MLEKLLYMEGRCSSLSCSDSLPQVLSSITLSAADAAAHIVENPFVLEHFKFLHHEIIVTLILIGLLGMVFKRFNEAIGTPSLS